MIVFKEMKTTSFVAQQIDTFSRFQERQKTKNYDSRVQ